MKTEHKEILALLANYLERPGHDQLRFGQALFNLGVYGFVNPQNPAADDFHCYDIHNDTDQSIINRIKSNL